MRPVELLHQEIRVAREERIHEAGRHLVNYSVREKPRARMAAPGIRDRATSARVELFEKTGERLLNILKALRMEARVEIAQERLPEALRVIEVSDEREVEPDDGIGPVTPQALNGQSLEIPQSV